MLPPRPGHARGVEPQAGDWIAILVRRHAVELVGVAEEGRARPPRRPGGWLPARRVNGATGGEREEGYGVEVGRWKNQ